MDYINRGLCDCSTQQFSVVEFILCSFLRTMFSYVN